MANVDVTTLAIEIKNQQANAAVDQFGSKLENTSAIAANAAKVIAGAFATSKIVRFVGESIKAFSDLEETTSKFGVIFKDVNSQAEQAVADLSRSFGQSELSARKLLSYTGDILTGFGLSAKASLELAAGVNKAGADVASFSNAAGGAEAVSAAFTKALYGETEAAKTYGVVIRQNSKEFKSLVASIMATTGATELQAKAFAAYQTILDQSKNALGDFERTQDSFANRTRILGNEFEMARAKIGEYFIPAVNDANGIALEILKTFNNLNPVVRDSIITLGVLGTSFVAIKSAMAAFALASAAKIALLGKSTATVAAETIAINANSIALARNASLRRLSGGVVGGGTGSLFDAKGFSAKGGMGGAGKLAAAAVPAILATAVYASAKAVDEIRKLISESREGVRKLDRDIDAFEDKAVQKISERINNLIKAGKISTAESAGLMGIDFSNMRGHGQAIQQIRDFEQRKAVIAIESDKYASIKIAANRKYMELELLEQAKERVSKIRETESATAKKIYDEMARAQYKTGQLTFDQEKQFMQKRQDAHLHMIKKLEEQEAKYRKAGANLVADSIRSETTSEYQAYNMLNKQLKALDEQREREQQKTQAQQRPISQFLQSIPLMRSTAQTAVNTGSVEALRLQSRTGAAPDSLQKAMLDNSKTTNRILERHSSLLNQLVSYAKPKTGTNANGITLQVATLT